MATINEKKLLSTERLQAAFKMFDKDNSGNITPAEIKSVLSADSNIPANVMKAIIDQVDENGDGEISFQEFVHLMTKVSEWNSRFNFPSSIL